MKTRTFAGWSFHGHVQNLSDDVEGEPTKATWRHGRGWLHFKNWDSDQAKTRPEHTGKKVINGSLHAEWSVPDRHPGLGFTWGGANAEDDWSLSIGLGVFHLYFSVDGLRSHASKYQKKPARYAPHRMEYVDDREISVRFFDKAVWWTLWMQDDWWSGDPKWRRGSWRPLDTLFGRADYTSRAIRTTNVTIPMPEGTYPATVELTQDTWKRPRAWWTTHRMRRAHIKVENGIPHPGKGENSYDCDEDATYGLTTEAANEAEAIGAMVATVMRDRQRHGGLDWQPVKQKAQS